MHDMATNYILHSSNLIDERVSLLIFGSRSFYFVVFYHDAQVVAIFIL